MPKEKKKDESLQVLDKSIKYQSRLKYNIWKSC